MCMRVCLCWCITMCGGRAVRYGFFVSLALAFEVLAFLYMQEGTTEQKSSIFTIVFFTLCV